MVKQVAFKPCVTGLYAIQAYKFGLQNPIMLVQAPEMGPVFWVVVHE
jgi:hypothetical protein